MSADFDRRTAGSVQASSEGRAMNEPTAMTPRPEHPRSGRLAATAGLAGVFAGAVLLLGGGVGRAEQAAAPVPAANAAPAAVTPAAAVPNAAPVARNGKTAAARTALGQPIGFEVPPQIFVVDAETLTQERARNKVVTTTRQALAQSGTAPLYAPPTTAELALREAALEALRKNLDIKRSGLSKASAERALIEAQAVFDPVFVATAAAALTSQFRRTEYPEKYKPGTEFVPVGALDSNGVFRCTPAAAALTQTPGVNGCYVITFPTRTTVLAEQFNHNRPAGYYQLGANEGVQANAPSEFAPRNQQVYTGTAEILQQLPWGPSLDLSLSTQRQQTYYPLNQFNGLQQTYGAYNRPYFTTIGIGAALPLPYTKNFGPTAADDVNADIARHNIDAAELGVRSVINSTLLSVDTLYWQLVGAVRSLDVANQSLQAAERQQASTQRLYDQGFVTESDRGQVLAQLSNIRTTQQQLFASYVTISESMRQLLDSDSNALLLPVGDGTLLKRPAADITEADRVLDNPDYQRQAVAVRIASLLRSQSEAQTRPNLSLTGNLSMAECCTYGYSDIGNSLLDAFITRDQFVATVSLLYQLPIGNRAAEAALDQAEHTLNQQATLLHQVELQTRESFETARGALASAREQVRIARQNVKIAQEVYNSALLQQDQGLVAAYETISRLSTLLAAHTALVQAEVQQRIAESSLLASVGALAEHYGDLTAQTAIDRGRLALLRESGALKHFGGPL
jgi:outer membrane protein TolC